jgi:hypothetical protein
MEKLVKNEGTPQSIRQVPVFLSSFLPSLLPSFVVVLGFELRDSSLLGKCATT